jgi:hypothetical protein
MKNRVVLLVALMLLLGFQSVLAQGPFPTPEKIRTFAKTKLLVVLDSRDIAFDAFLKNAVSKHWNLSDFEFVDSERFEKEKSNPDFSFLVTLQIKFENDPEGNVYNYLNVLFSHPTGDLKEMPVLAQVPFQGSSLAGGNNFHKTEMLVKFLHNYTSKIIASNGDASFKRLSHLNKSMKKLSGKTLFVTKEQLDFRLRSETLLKNVYKHNVQIVSEDELVDIVSAAQKGNVVLHIVAPEEDAVSGRCFKMIIEPATGDGYFYKTHRITPTRAAVMLKNDFRKIRWYPIHWL